MTPHAWKLKYEDGHVDEFTDVRRKVGNIVIRAFLLKGLLESQNVERVTAQLRGPKDEFKDFDRFAVLAGVSGGVPFKILVESGVYENLRIVAADGGHVLTMGPREMVEVFTRVLMHPADYSAGLVVSVSSRVRAE